MSDAREQAFQQFCRSYCSPGGNRSAWYRTIFDAGWNAAQADAPAPLPADAAEQQNDKVHMSNVTDDPSSAPADSEAKDDELPGMLALAQGVAEQRWPHTIDAVIWAREWMKQIAAHPFIPRDEGCMIGWFANAIMAGYDTAQARAVAPAERPCAAAPARDALVDTPLSPLLSADPDIMHGALCVAGTRIPVTAVQNYHDAGYSHDAIIKDYPDLTHAQIDAAIGAAYRPTRPQTERLERHAELPRTTEAWCVTARTLLREAAAALAQRDVPREPTDSMRSTAFNYAEGFAISSTVTAQGVLNAFYAILDAATQERSDAQRGFRLMPSNETLRRQIENDPDDDPTAGDYECTR